MCHKKEFFIDNLLRKKDSKEQGFYGVSDEPIMFEAEGRKYCPDIVSIKDGEIAFMDISIDEWHNPA
ncbi:MULTISPECIES: hypothetical protein [unclassified Bartonella]|uniref:hypothetical protein n=1 Tax=unclassified Bartonella TaxID=2645622 RepID=UPI00235E2288|nr:MULTISPECIES: hypothetical protein [unclassified Bartonella]